MTTSVIPSPQEVPDLVASKVCQGRCFDLGFGLPQNAMPETATRALGSAARAAPHAARQMLGE